MMPKIGFDMTSIVGIYKLSAKNRVIIMTRELKDIARKIWGNLVQV